MKTTLSNLSITGLVAILLAACAPVEVTRIVEVAAEPVVAASPATGPVELTYSERNSSPAAWGEMQWAVDSCNEKNKDKFHVTVSGIDGVTFRTKAPIELRSDTPPDIFFSWEGGWAQ